jgi:hypothetical protein
VNQPDRSDGSSSSPGYNSPAAKAAVDKLGNTETGILKK